MKFTNDDYPRPKKHGNELTDAIEEGHPKGLITVAEQRIMATHHHDDGSPVKLHEMGANEIFTGPSLEGKLSFGSQNEKAVAKAEPADTWQQILQQQSQPQGSTEKIQYERNKNQGGGLTYGHETAKFDTAAFASQSKRQETFMMGCNCGVEWTVTGVRTKSDSSNPAAGAVAIKIEQYGSPAGGAGAAGYNVSSGSGSGPGEYKAGGGQKQEYKG